MMVPVSNGINLLSNIIKYLILLKTVFDGVNNNMCSYFSHFVLSCYLAFVPSFYRAIVLSCYLAFVLSCLRAIVPPCYRAFVLSCLRSIVLSCLRSIVLSFYRAIVPSCLRSFRIMLTVTVSTTWEYFISG